MNSCRAGEAAAPAPALEREGGPGAGRSEAAPFGWGRGDAGCPEPVGRAGAGESASCPRCPARRPGAGKGEAHRLREACV